MRGPEEKWEDRKLWDEERKREQELDREVAQTEIITIQVDDKYDDGR